MLMLKRWEIGGKAKKAVLNSVLYSMSHRIKSWQSHNAHHSIKSWVKRSLEAVLSHIAATEMMLFDFKPSECFTYNAFHLSHMRQSHPSWNAWHDALHKFARWRMVPFLLFSYVIQVLSLFFHLKISWFLIGFFRLTSATLVFRLPCLL